MTTKIKTKYSQKPASSSTRGLTLIEVLFALVIVVGLTGSSVSFMKRRDNHIKKTFRQLMALNRQLDYQARLSGDIRRLVISLDKDKNTYWVEKKINKVYANSFTGGLSDTAEDLKTGDIVNQTQKEDLQTAESFVMDKEFFEEPQTLPKKFVFESMELSHQKDPITEGATYIYYLPAGQFSTALVLVKHKKSYRSLFFNRLTGELTMFHGKKTLTDLKQ